MKNLFIEQFKGWRLQEIAWLIFCISAISGFSLYFGDNAIGITAAITGMAYTILAGKGKVTCFLFGIINTPIYAYMAFNAGYYGDFALNVYYFIMMFPGLYFWLKNSSSDPEEGIKRTRLSTIKRVILSTLIIGFILPVWLILNKLGGSSPLCDAATNVLSIAAMILTIRRAIEEWILWIIVNSIEIIMWYKAWINGDGAISLLLMWLLFLINGIYLLSLWLRVERKSKMNAKTQLRKKMRSLRKALSITEKNTLSKNICKKLLADKDIAQAKTIAVYFASPDEIDLNDLIKASLARNATIVAPKWNGKSYNLAKVKGLSNEFLIEGPMHILEPKEPNIVHPNEVDAWIIPGLAFTLDGKRLGYGGGWYDRLLAKSNPLSAKIAVAHTFQVVDDIPTEKHDIRLNRIITTT
jgi:nicotinamide mononucleotide transporter